MLLALLACYPDQQTRAADNELPTPDNAAIAEFVTAYYKTPPAERRQYVIDTEDFDAGQERYYRNNTKSPDDVQCKVNSVTAGPKPNYLTVRVQRKVVVGTSEQMDVIDCFLFKTKNGLKADWGATIGYNAAGSTAWRAGKDDTLTLRVTARLGTYYNFGYTNANETHYSILLFDTSSGNEVRLHGYALKDSQPGRKLFEILKDEQNTKQW